MSQPVVLFEVIGQEPERLRTYFGELFGWESARLRRWQKRYRIPDSTGSWTWSPPTMGQVFAVGSEADRGTQATLSFTLASRMSRRCCSSLKASEAHV